MPNGRKKRDRRKGVSRRPAGRIRSRSWLVLLAAAAALAAVSAPGVRAAVSAAIAESRAVEARQTRTALYADRYDIPLDLARAIHAAAEAEGVDPDLAFRLVEVESSFEERAVSPAGALGLTQLMPATAGWLQPGISREQIFDRQTNLRLGFRYFRMLLRSYDGRVDEALHAYNRGPGTVDRLRAQGLDPANGYADRVLGRGEASVYRGSGLLPRPRSGPLEGR